MLCHEKCPYLRAEHQNVSPTLARIIVFCGNCAHEDDLPFDHSPVFPLRHRSVKCPDPHGKNFDCEKCRGTKEVLEAYWETPEWEPSRHTECPLLTIDLQRKDRDRLKLSRKKTEPRAPFNSIEWFEARIAEANAFCGPRLPEEWYPGVADINQVDLETCSSVGLSV